MHGIMFHHFHRAGEKPPAQGSITPEQLEAIIDYLQSGYTLLSAHEWLRRFLECKIRDEICLTFDDGLKCQYDLALPVLRRRGIRAFFFVYTCIFHGWIDRLEIYRLFRNRFFPTVNEFYERFWNTAGKSIHFAGVSDAVLRPEAESYLREYSFYTDEDRRFRYVRDKVLSNEAYQSIMDGVMETFGMTPETLATNLWLSPKNLMQLADEGHVLGLHGYTHSTTFASKPREEQEREYALNRSDLELLSGVPPISMSHPSNSYSADTLAILGTMGVRVWFRANMRPGESKLEIPRMDVADLLKEMQANEGTCVHKQLSPASCTAE